MKPLQSVAMGFVFVALYARFHGYDAYADPFGWLLVVLGVRRLPAATPLRPTMRATGSLSLVVSVPLWLPAVHDRLADLDASLGWAADLPAFAFLAVLCHGLAQAADLAGDERPARRLRLVRTVVVVVALLPVVVFGAGVDALGPTAALAAQALYVALVWLMFSCSGRLWAGATLRVESAAERM